MMLCVSSRDISLPTIRLPFTTVVPKHTRIAARHTWLTARLLLDAAHGPCRHHNRPSPLSRHFMPLQTCLLPVNHHRPRSIPSQPSGTSAAAVNLPTPSGTRYRSVTALWRIPCAFGPLQLAALLFWTLNVDSLRHVTVDVAAFSPASAIYCDAIALPLPTTVVQWRDAPGWWMIRLRCHLQTRTTAGRFRTPAARCHTWRLRSAVCSNSSPPGPLTAWDCYLPPCLLPS